MSLFVRGPDGKPLLQTSLVIKVVGGSPFRPPIPDVPATTDDRGVARFEVPAGTYSMSITAHNVGYGTVGVMEFVPGTIAQPDMPPLSGYGSIDVVVPPGCGRNVIIYAGSAEHSLLEDSSNELHIDDLPADKLSVSVPLILDHNRGCTVVLRKKSKTSTRLRCDNVTSTLNPARTEFLRTTG